jgi:hypothetical protein
VGVMPSQGDSIEEYVRRLTRIAPSAERPLGRVARLLTARLYRQQPLDPAEERGLVSDWQIVRDVLRNLRRR